jgi:hypothetical protein
MEQIPPESPDSKTTKNRIWFREAALVVRRRIQVEVAVVHVHCSGMKFAAKRYGAAAVPPTAHPVYTAPDLELSKRIDALVPLTA